MSMRQNTNEMHIRARSPQHTRSPQRPHELLSLPARGNFTQAIHLPTPETLGSLHLAPRVIAPATKAPHASSVPETASMHNHSFPVTTPSGHQPWCWKRNCSLGNCRSRRMWNLKLRMGSARRGSGGGLGELLRGTFRRGGVWGE
jgi:hypothetical protein